MAAIVSGASGPAGPAAMAGRYGRRGTAQATVARMSAHSAMTSERRCINVLLDTEVGAHGVRPRKYVGRQRAHTMRPYSQDCFSKVLAVLGRLVPQARLFIHVLLRHPPKFEHRSRGHGKLSP